MLKDTFSKELKGATIIEDYVTQGTMFKTMTLEYLLFSIGKHYFSLSVKVGYENLGYVISENETAERDSYMIPFTCKQYSRNKMKEYIKQLVIRYIEN